MDKLTIREWPSDDRPREKLFALGEQNLSDAELLAILLRTGSRGQSALDLAREVLRALGGSLRHVHGAGMADWMATKGLGEAKIAQIKAALELGRRVLEEEIREERPQIQSAKDAAELLMPRMRDLKVEVFKAVYLNAQGRVIAIEDVAVGTVDHAAPIIREILHKALVHYASGMICAHNHPSGSLAASREDKVFTRYLKSACHLMGIKFIDHIIISFQGYRSIAAESE